VTDLLDDLVGTPPPSTVDVDRIIARERRARRWRWAASGGSAAAAVVLAIVAGQLAGGSRPVAPPAPALPAAAPAPLTPARLGAILEAATAKYAPDAKWIYMPDVPGEKPTPDGHPVMSGTSDPVTFGGRSGITANGRKGGFYLRLGPRVAPAGYCDQILGECEPVTTPGGLPAAHWVDRPDDKYVFYGMDVALPDWTLTIQAVNYFGGDASPASAPVPPLTSAQVDAITGEVADRIAAARAATTTPSTR
jgi:hypothetical protein